MIIDRNLKKITIKSEAHIRKFKSSEKYIVAQIELFPTIFKSYFEIANEMTSSQHIFLQIVLQKNKFLKNVIYKNWTKILFQIRTAY